MPSPSAREGRAALLFVFAHCRRARRKLQDGRLLTFAKRSQKHDLPVRKLQCVVMHMRRFLIDLTEDRRHVLEAFHALPEESRRFNRNLSGKRNFGSGKQAYSRATIFRSAEAPCSGTEISGRQLV